MGRYHRVVTWAMNVMMTKHYGKCKKRDCRDSTRDLPLQLNDSTVNEICDSPIIETDSTEVCDLPVIETDSTVNEVCDSPVSEFDFGDVSSNDKQTETRDRVVQDDDFSENECRYRWS